MTEHEQDYHLSRKSEWLADFDEEARCWSEVLGSEHAEEQAGPWLAESRAHFEALIAEIPYIGGDENHLTPTLVRSARCLALHRARQAHGVTASYTGKVLYRAISECDLYRSPESPPGGRLSQEELMQRRMERALRSQARRYPADWVYTFVRGDGESFDYGYDFSECGVQKFYRAQGADDLMPFFCFLDFAFSRTAGLGLSRTMSLAEGHALCNHRFKQGRETALDWPPPFLQQ